MATSVAIPSLNVVALSSTPVPLSPRPGPPSSRLPSAVQTPRIFGFAKSSAARLPQPSNVTEAAAAGDVKALAQFIEERTDAANSEHTSTHLLTPLMIAIMSQDGAEPVQLLLDAGAKLDAQSRCGNTALHWCASMGNAAACAALIAAGADVQVANDWGTTALVCADQRGRLPTRRLLQAAVSVVEAAQAEERARLDAEAAEQEKNAPAPEEMPQMFSASEDAENVAAAAEAPEA